MTCPNGCTDCSQENDTCSVCNKGLFFVDGVCLPNCPEGYIEDTPTACSKPEPPVYKFTKMFQKTDNYQCFLFPFSAGSVFVALILWLATCCSKSLIEKDRQKIL